MENLIDNKITANEPQAEQTELNLTFVCKDCEQEFFYKLTPDNISAYNIIKETCKGFSTINAIKYMGEKIQICDSCRDAYVMCENCGNYEKNDLSHETADGTVCGECFNDLYVQCENCEEYHKSENTGTVNTSSYRRNNREQTWCKNCIDNDAFMCQGCEETFHENLIHSSDCSEHRYCECCFDETFSCCSGCNEYFFQSDIDSDGYCENCREEEETGCIHSHDFTPKDLKIYGKKEKTEFQNTFGIELETESKGNKSPSWLSQEIFKNNFPVYCKRDGSLNDGVEIVTHPMTYKYIMDNKQIFSNMLALARKNGFKSYDTDTCGIHIHVSRKEIGTLHFYKILKLIYENPSLVVLIAQRKLSTINRWASLTGDNKITYKAKRKDKVTGDKYTAVNMCHSETFEFRVFKGTLNEKSFFKNIEFIKAIIDFTREISIQAVTEKNLLMFVKENKKEFLNLFDFLTAKNKYNVIHTDKEFKQE